MHSLCEVTLFVHFVSFSLFIVYTIVRLFFCRQYSSVLCCVCGFLQRSFDMRIRTFTVVALVHGVGE